MSLQLDIANAVAIKMTKLAAETKDLVDAADKDTRDSTYSFRGPSTPNESYTEAAKGRHTVSPASMGLHGALTGSGAFAPVSPIAEGGYEAMSNAADAGDINPKAFETDKDGNLTPQGIADRRNEGIINTMTPETVRSNLGITDRPLSRADYDTYMKRLGLKAPPPSNISSNKGIQNSVENALSQLEGDQPGVASISEIQHPKYIDLPSIGSPEMDAKFQKAYQDKIETLRNSGKSVNSTRNAWKAYADFLNKHQTLGNTLYEADQLGREVGDNFGYLFSKDKDGGSLKRDLGYILGNY